jgi:predicted secreted hydrolase
MSKKGAKAFSMRILILAIVMIGAGLLLSLNQAGAADEVQSQVAGIPVSSEGFQRAEVGRVFQFPADHGPHDEYQTEWWYYTGNLTGEGGERFGYQLTFFRRALLPVEQRQERQSNWAADQVYLAHFTLTDVNGRTFQAFEKLGRGAGGLAGATGEPAYRVWLDDWMVEQVGKDEYLLRASAGNVSLDLLMVDQKGPALQGEAGYSQKGPEAGNASYYYSLSRLQSTGRVEVDEQTYTVSGYSWMDHEFSTSALSEKQVGWDWFALQLDDGSELMVYTIRREDGSIDAYSRGTLILADGSIRHLSQKDFSITVTETWRSPHSGAIYPSAWIIAAPSEGILLEVKPLLSDQELNLSYVYWEGAVEITGERDGQVVGGRGYVELTGYAQSMQGQF